ncbi:MAG: lysoplasmalogenase [Acidimicrobiia bacterium]
MNEGVIAALGSAVVFAVGDWVSRAAHTSSPARRRLEFVCKPATILALVIAAALLDPATGAGIRQRWFVAALVCSLVGDVLLMLPHEQFVGGLAAFLAAHVCYVVGFWTDGPAAAAFVVAAFVVTVAIGSLGRRILPAVRRQDRRLVAPVAAYMVVIGAMVATALAVGNPAAALGAVLFAASDSMIAWDRFVGGFDGAGVWIMVTYHLGQVGLVVSLLR